MTKTIHRMAAADVPLYKTALRAPVAIVGCEEQTLCEWNLMPDYNKPPNQHRPLGLGHPEQAAALTRKAKQAAERWAARAAAKAAIADAQRAQRAQELATHLEARDQRHATRMLAVAHSASLSDSAQHQKQGGDDGSGDDDDQPSQPMHAQQPPKHATLSALPRSHVALRPAIEASNPFETRLLLSRAYGRLHGRGGIGNGTG